MSAMNPLKYLGGLVLEIGAVVAALAFIPALGGSPADLWPSAAPAGTSANQVFFDAQSSRVIEPAVNRAPPAAWRNEFAAQPPIAQQRFVEEMLDHNSQRALNTATRLWTRGDELLPPELRVRAAPPELQSPPPAQPRELNPPPSHYAPRPRLDDRY